MQSAGSEVAVGAGSARRAQDLLTLSRTQLDELFTRSAAGPIPDGPSAGTVIIGPATALSPAIARFVRLLAWQGKTFDAAHGTLANRISPFGVHAIVADVYKADSLLDKRECIVLDYSKTSVLAGSVRDEIRQVEPGLYLGKVFWRRRRLFVDFALQF